MPEAIRAKLINCHYNDLLANYFEIDKTPELVL